MPYDNAQDALRAIRKQKKPIGKLGQIAKKAVMPMKEPPKAMVAIHLGKSLRKKALPEVAKAAVTRIKKGIYGGK